MTAKEFRRIALAFPGTVEAAHMDHPDFRIGGKIFATLGYPDETSGMVVLAPEEQRHFVQQAPDTFSPCNGIWGKRGATNVRLASVKKNTLRVALEAAYRNVAAKVKTKNARH